MPDKQRNKHVLSPAMQKAKWTKGKSGNPKGRPPLPKCLTEQMRADGDALLPDMAVWPQAWRNAWPFIAAMWPDTKTIRQMVSHMAWIQAVSDPVARERLLDRIEGKAITPVELSTPGGALSIEAYFLAKQDKAGA